MHFEVLYNNQYKTKNFSIAIAKAKATSRLIDPIEKNYSNSKDKNLYRDNFKRNNLTDIDQVAKIAK